MRRIDVRMTLAGVVVLQVARNRELRRRLDERRAEESVEVEWEEEEELE